MVGRKLGVPLVEVLRNHHDRIASLEEKLGETRFDVISQCALNPSMDHKKEVC